MTLDSSKAAIMLPLRTLESTRTILEIMRRTVVVRGGNAWAGGFTEVVLGSEIGKVFTPEIDMTFLVKYH